VGLESSSKRRNEACRSGKKVRYWVIQVKILKGPAGTDLVAQPTENTRHETSGRPKRKIVVVLNQCLCGETADPASGMVLECKQTVRHDGQVLDLIFGNSLSYNFNLSILVPSSLCGTRPGAPKMGLRRLCIFSGKGGTAMISHFPIRKWCLIT